MEYEKKDVLRLAKRLNNTKRAYLLVNPLQGKHIPVRPSAALEMMDCLGEKLRQRFPGTKLVIGFAETATAIGAAAASRFSDGCVYIHTTRENLAPDTEWVCFQEEHSHATDQKLCADNLREWLSATTQVILVDDELSTGKTILNMVAQMRRMFPEMRDKPVAAASIINRLSEENEARLLAEGIACVYLVHIPNEDYTSEVRCWQTERPTDRRRTCVLPDGVRIQTVALGSADPRAGVTVERYRQACADAVTGVMPYVRNHLGPDKRVLVLGTEEFMYLPLRLAYEIERAGLAESVSFHATTRSPIEVSQMPEYPLFNGYRITSFYEEDRDTYIYDLADYDTAIILSDSRAYPPASVCDLASALRENGCKDIILLTGGGNV